MTKIVLIVFQFVQWIGYQWLPHKLFGIFLKVCASKLSNFFWNSWPEVSMKICSQYQIDSAFMFRGVHRILCLLGLASSPYETYTVCLSVCQSVTKCLLFPTIRFFLIFCMKSGFNKCSKVTKPVSYKRKCLQNISLFEYLWSGKQFDKGEDESCLLKPNISANALVAVLGSAR